MKRMRYQVLDEIGVILARDHIDGEVSSSSL